MDYSPGEEPNQAVSSLVYLIGGCISLEGLPYLTRDTIFPRTGMAPDLDLAANSPLLSETDRYVYLEIEETPSCQYIILVHAVHWGYRDN